MTEKTTTLEILDAVVLRIFVKPEVHAQDFSRQIDQSSSTDLTKSLNFKEASNLLCTDPSDFCPFSVPVQSEESLQCRPVLARNKHAHTTTSAKNSKNAGLLKISRGKWFSALSCLLSDVPMISDIPKSNRPAHQLPMEIPGRFTAAQGTQVACDQIRHQDQVQESPTSWPC